MSSPTSRSGYVRLDNEYNPLSTDPGYLIYHMNWKGLEDLAERERREQNQKLAEGHQALVDRRFKVAVDAFEQVLRDFPKNLEAKQGLQMAQESLLKELRETSPAIDLTLRANRALDQLLIEYGDANHPKSVLEKFRERLLAISEMYRSVSVLDLNGPVPKYPQLRRCYDHVERQIRNCVRAELAPMMEERLKVIQNYSLKNERHLNAILAHCRAWDQAYEEGDFLLGSDQMYNKTQVDQISAMALLAKHRLETVGLFFVEAIDQAILDLIPKWKMDSKNRIHLISFYNVLFMNSQPLRNRWMSLTPRGMEMFQEEIKSHVSRQIRGQSWLTICFFAKTVQRKLKNGPPVIEEDIEHWLTQIEKEEHFVDIPDRLKMIRFEAKEEGDSSQRWQTF